MAKKQRPCKICGRWFTPNPRLGDRQKTCGSSECKREWHKRKCGEWNSKNREYFRGIYLKKKILSEGTPGQTGSDSTGKMQSSPGRAFFRLGLPWPEIQEVMGAKMAAVIEYIIQFLLRRFQEMLNGQPIVITG